MATTTASSERVAEVVRENAASLLRLARRHSLCDDDAADAYQGTLEIYLTRVDRIDHGSAGAWLRTVCKHEAMRLRAARQRVAPADPMEWDEQPAADPHEADERAASLERVARAAEALQACRPEEARAMLLRADGSSYAEIGELCGWSYSKVNRHLADGRARFLKRFARIESGGACAGYAHLLSAIVDGEATPDDYLRLRPHLRHCAHCRATLKAMYECEPVLGALVPAGALVLVAPDGPGLIARAFGTLGAEVGDRLARAHAVLEAATATKAAAVVASTAAVAAGGAAVVDHVAPARATARSAPAIRAAATGPRVRPAAALPAPGAAPTVAATPVTTAAPTAPTVAAAVTPAPEPAATVVPMVTPAATTETFTPDPAAPSAPAAPAQPAGVGFERIVSGPPRSGGGGAIGFEG